MSAKEKSKEIAVISSRISSGSKYWKDQNESKFKKYRNYLKINHYPGDTRTDQVTVPYVHAIVRAKLPSLYFRNPKAIIKPKRKISPDSQKLIMKNIDNIKSVMEYLPEEIGMEQECKRAILDYVAFGKGVVKIGFEFEKDDENKKIMVDRFYVKRVGYPNGDFIYDPESTNGLAGARWCAEKITEPLEDVKGNKLFENTSDLEPNATIDESILLDNDSKVDEVNKDRDRLEYWHYWHKDRYGVVDKCCYVVTDQKKILKEYDSSPFGSDWPYEEVNNYQVPDYAFPIGDIEPIDTQQQELDSLESILIRHAKTFIQKYVGQKGDLDEKAKSALESPNHTYIETKDSPTIRALENPSVNSTVPLSTDTIKFDMTKVTAVSDYDTAVVPEKSRTLGEAQLIQSGSENRKEDARRDIVEFMKRVYRKLLVTVQMYMTEDMLLMISGDGSSANDWKSITPEMIEGEYDVDIEPISVLPTNKNQIRQDTLLLFREMIKDPMLPIEGKSTLRKWLLEAFDKKEFELFTTTPESLENSMLAKNIMEADLINRTPQGYSTPPGNDKSIQVPGAQPQTEI
jgi:hypothetical protein